MLVLYCNLNDGLLHPDSEVMIIKLSVYSLITTKITTLLNHKVFEVKALWKK